MWFGFPPGEKHWHGAKATTAMTHNAIQEQLNGKTATGWKRSAMNSTSGLVKITAISLAGPDQHSFCDECTKDEMLLENSDIGYERVRSFFNAAIRSKKIPYP
jgi:hypothetical protein